MAVRICLCRGRTRGLQSHSHPDKAGCFGIAPEFPIEIPQPVRVPRSKLTKTNELEKAVLLA